MARNALTGFHPLSIKNRCVTDQKQAKFNEKLRVSDFGKKYFLRGKFLISPQPTYFAL